MMDFLCCAWAREGKGETWQNIKDNLGINASPLLTVDQDLLQEETSQGMVAKKNRITKNVSNNESTGSEKKKKKEKKKEKLFKNDKDSSDEEFQPTNDAQRSRSAVIIQKYARGFIIRKRLAKGEPLSDIANILDSDDTFEQTGGENKYKEVFMRRIIGMSKAIEANAEYKQGKNLTQGHVKFSRVYPPELIIETNKNSEGEVIKIALVDIIPTSIIIQKDVNVLFKTLNGNRKQSSHELKFDTTKSSEAWKKSLLLAHEYAKSFAQKLVDMQEERQLRGTAS